MVKSAAKKDGGKPAPVKVKVGRTSKAAAASKKPKKSRPLPKSWPVASHLKYPISNDMDGGDLDSSVSEQQTSLQPGKTLQQNCNGCDVFLRKGAVQSTSAAIIPTKKNSTSKGAIKRFLIVFPGRIALKAPPPVAASKDDTTKEADHDDQNDDKTTNNNDIDDDNNAATKPAKRNPFAPSNPHQLLGRLVSLGGAEQKVELRIPFPANNSSNGTADDHDSNNIDTHKTQLEQQQNSQMVMSGKAIPLSGKFMALSFKRTGGKVSSSAASTPKNKKMGTGSINCKDIFRSVIVLGDSNVLDKSDKKVEAVVDANEEMKSCHYGGSERTVDGGGKNEGKVSTTAAKGRLKATAPTPQKDGEEFSVENPSSDSGDDQEDDEIIALDDDNSDDEFVPTSSRKRRSVGATKKADSDEDTPVARKRTPRRSTATTKIKYVDSDSDVDMSDDDSTKSDDDSGKSNKVTQDVDESSDDSVVVEEIIETKKRSGRTACKKRKLSNGSSRSGHDDDSSLIVIDSEDEVKPPKKSSKPNGSKKANGSKVAVLKSNARAEKTAPSSPPKSVSPRRRKKVSPRKPSPKKSFPLDLDDDPFTFL